MRAGSFSIAAISIGAAISLLPASCDRRNILIDPQGNEYRTIKIGNQEWTRRNLVLDVGEGSYCYNDDPELCIEMGRLYTWETAQKASSQIRGWHIPTKREWQELIASCGGDTAGYEMIISESFGFDPQWSGVRISSGTYKGAEIKGVNYWSSTATDTNAAYAYSVAILSNLKIISPHNYPKVNACSVRLMRDR